MYFLILKCFFFQPYTPSQSFLKTCRGRSWNRFASVWNMFDNLLYNILTIQESSTWVWDRNLLNHWKRAFFPIHFAAHCCQKWQKVTLNPQTGLFWQSFFVVRAGLWVVNGQTEGPSRALDLETSEPRLIVIVKAPELITSNYHNLELITSNCNIEEFVQGKYMWMFFNLTLTYTIFNQSKLTFKWAPHVPSAFWDPLLHNIS